MSTKWKRRLLFALVLILIALAVMIENLFIVGFLASFSMLEAYNMGAEDAIAAAKKALRKEGED